MLARTNLGSVNADIPIYTVPAGKHASVSVNVVNRNDDVSPKIRLAVTDGGAAPSPDGADHFEYDVAVAPNAAFERTGLVLLAGQTLFARTDTLGVGAQVYGFAEYDASAISASSTSIDSGVG